MHAKTFKALVSMSWSLMIIYFGYISAHKVSNYQFSTGFHFNLIWFLSPFNFSFCPRFFQLGSYLPLLVSFVFLRIFFVFLPTISFRYHPPFFTGKVSEQRCVGPPPYLVYGTPRREPPFPPRGGAKWFFKKFLPFWTRTPDYSFARSPIHTLMILFSRTTWYLCSYACKSSSFWSMATGHPLRFSNLQNQNREHTNRYSTSIKFDKPFCSSLIWNDKEVKLDPVFLIWVGWKKANC